MTLSNSPDDLEFGDVSGEQADVTSPGDPETLGKDAPSSGPSDADGDLVGTEAGDPLAGIGQPEGEVDEPDGS